MKILVTGAAGFIGSNLVEYLLNKNIQVVGLDNFNDFYNPKIKKYNIKDFENNPNFKMYDVDLLNQVGMEAMFQSEGPIDHIVHLAAWAGVTHSLQHPVDYARNNLEGTINLADLAVKYGVKKFVFASTSSVYGKKNPTPYLESMPTDSPLAPYPATKKACEVMLSSYAENTDLSVIVLRLFNPVGPRQRPDLVMPKLIRSCEYGDKFPLYWKPEELQSTKRDYFYVVHLFDAIMSSFDIDAKYEIFNIGNSAPTPLAHLLDAVEKISGKKLNIEHLPTRQGEMFVTFADTTKAKNMLNFNPDTSIEKIVEIYYNWYMSQEEWYKKGQF